MHWVLDEARRWSESENCVIHVFTKKDKGYFFYIAWRVRAA